MFRILMVMIRVAAAFIEEDNRVLVTKRANGQFAGYWEFPGGKIEEGETPAEAIVREIREELGIPVRAEAIIGRYRHRYDFGSVEVILIRCVRNGRIPICSDGSHTEHTWTAIPPNSLKFVPLDRKIIRTIGR